MTLENINMKIRILISLILLSSISTMHTQWNGTNTDSTKLVAGIEIAQPSPSLHINNHDGQSRIIEIKKK